MYIWYARRSISSCVGWPSVVCRPLPADDFAIGLDMTPSTTVSFVILNPWGRVGKGEPGEPGDYSYNLHHDSHLFHTTGDRDQFDKAFRARIDALRAQKSL